jgi:hypothetical protein
MRHVPSKSGPFSERPYYDDREIEQICVDALLKVDLLPSRPQAIRIDRFIEKHFKVVPTYEELPAGVLGLARFDGAGIREVVVAKTLDDDTGVVAERRIRTTLTHEGGHGLLHAHLFVRATPSRGLFGDFSEPDTSKVLCRDVGIGSPSFSYSGQWWEYQANRALAALLLPLKLVEAAVDDYLGTSPVGFKYFDHSKSEATARKLADTFEVNPVVVRLRLKQVFPVDASQPLLR